MGAASVVPVAVANDAGRLTAGVIGRRLIFILERRVVFIGHRTHPAADGGVFELVEIGERGAAGWRAAACQNRVRERARCRSHRQCGTAVH